MRIMEFDWKPKVANDEAMDELVIVLHPKKSHLWHYRTV